MADIRRTRIITTATLEQAWICRRLLIQADPRGATGSPSISTRPADGQRTASFNAYTSKTTEELALLLAEPSGHTLAIK